MKKLLILCAMVLAPAAHALELEVHPLSLQARAEVMGVEVAVDGQRAIVLTGKAAEEVAQLAGVAFDKSTQMIIATGEEVEKAWDVTSYYTRKAGETVVTETKEFSDAALTAVKKSVRLGKVAYRETREFAVGLAGKIGDSIASGIDRGLIFVTDTGSFLGGTYVRIMHGTVDFACGFFKLFDRDLKCGN